MNERALLTLGLVLGAASGKAPDQWLDQLHDRMRQAQAESPMNAAALTVLASALVFYVAEREKNPKVTSLLDALVYASTNLSVGYSDIFAKTPVGKAVGTALMTYGPALAARVFDPPQTEEARPAASDASLRQLGDKLDAILQELRAQRVSSAT